MSEENTAVPAPAQASDPPAPQASELPPGGQAPQVDGDASAPAVEAQPEPEPQESDEEKSKKKERFDKRFSDLTRARREAELRAARAEGELNALRSMMGKPNGEGTQPVSAPASGPPNPKDYPQGEYDPEFAADKALWKLERKQATERQAEAERTRREAAEAAMAEGRARIESTLELARDAADGEAGEYFQNAERVLGLAFVPVQQGGIPRHLADSIAMARNPVHVAEVLGRQPERLSQLRGLNMTQAALEIGALDAQISASLKRRQAAAEQAAAPRPAPRPTPAAVPTAPAAGGAAVFDPEKASMSDYVRWRESQNGRG